MYQAKKRNSTTSKVWTVIGLIAVSIAFVFALKVGLDRQAVVDCYKWQKWDKEYRLFQPSADMIGECRSLGVDIKN